MRKTRKAASPPAVARVDRVAPDREVEKADEVIAELERRLRTIWQLANGASRANIVHAALSALNYTNEHWRKQRPLRKKRTESPFDPVTPTTPASVRYHPAGSEDG